MCKFVSWVERRGKVYFLTGEQLFKTEKGKEFIKTISPDDYFGHGTIRAWYGIDEGDGMDRDCTSFSSPSNFPPIIVDALKEGRFKVFSLPRYLLCKPLDEKYHADCLSLYEKYWADLQSLYEKYWGLFALPENRNEAWR